MGGVGESLRVRKSHHPDFNVSNFVDPCCFFHRRLLILTRFGFPQQRRNTHISARKLIQKIKPENI